MEFREGKVESGQGKIRGRENEGGENCGGETLGRD